MSNSVSPQQDFARELMVEQLQTAATPETAAPPRWKRILCRTALAVGIATGAATGAAIAADEDLRHDIAAVVSDLPDMGYAPPVDVSSAGTEGLISAVDGLNEGGTWAMLGGFALGGMLWAYGRTERGKPLADFANYQRKATGSIAKKVLPPIIVAFAANAATLGGTAADGAVKPVDEVMEALDIGQNTPVVVHDSEYVPFSAGSLAPAKYKKMQAIVRNDGGQLVPVRFALGSVSNPSKTTNPSSAPITALPQPIIKEAFGVDLPPIESCDDMQVVVGEQLGAKPGSEVVVNGVRAKVAATVDMHPGLDRVAVFAAQEQADKCIFEGEPYSGAVILGEEGRLQELQDKFREAGIDYPIEDLAALKEQYKDFWERSVDPPEMQLILLVAALGTMATLYMSRSDIQSQRRAFAGLRSNKVSLDVLKKAAALRAVGDINRAAAWGTPAVVALAAVTNSSQYGLDVAATPRAVGAGYMVYAGSRLLAYAGERRALSKIDVPGEIRSSL